MLLLVLIIVVQSHLAAFERARGRSTIIGKCPRTGAKRYFAVIAAL